ncbi:hypothetical protein KC19_3G219800 [Ceratodon purpureus]|uniref:PGG domain-containing protein n=1 Tax=Ceratodon purpureus TaxID=3225 RepID=A0A8T0IQ91_CERPU|nr:hypothetical protein KC19_3G219800 [Ceratodon purpureus]
MENPSLENSVTVNLADMAEAENVQNSAVLESSPSTDSYVLAGGIEAENEQLSGMEYLSISTASRVLKVLDEVEAVQSSEILEAFPSTVLAALPNIVEEEYYDEQRLGKSSSAPTILSVKEEITEPEYVPTLETEATDANKPQKYQLKVKMCCPKCEEKVYEGFLEIHGLVRVDINRKKNTVLVFAIASGLDEQKLLRKARVVDKKARFVPLDVKEKRKPNVYPDYGEKVNDIVKRIDKLKFNDLAKDTRKKDSVVRKFLEDNNMKGAQEKVEELFQLREDIEFLIKIELVPDELQQLVNEMKNDIRRIDIYYQLFMHALRDISKARSGVSMVEKDKESENPSTPSDSMISANPSQYYEATDFLVLLINKVQAEEDIMTAADERKTLITKCVHMYEKETLAVCCYHVLGEEFKEAEELFENIIKCMKPSDVTNRCRIYNYALQQAKELPKVLKSLISGPVSQRYSLPENEILHRFGMEHDKAVNDKFQKFFVDLFLKDNELVQRKDQLTFAWLEKNKYTHLIKCLSKCYFMHKSEQLKLWNNDIHSTDNLLMSNWAHVRPYVEYILHLAARSASSLHIIKQLFKLWPELDVNAQYNGVTALHVAAFEGHEKLVKFFLDQNKLDINMKTGPLEDGKKGTMWCLPTCQTALHISTAQGHAKVVKLLCGMPHLHRQVMRCHEEDDEELTALDILYDNLNLAKKFSDASIKETERTLFSLEDVQKGVDRLYRLREIERTLLRLEDVQKGIDRLYRNRQVHVDAANTILVGAALIAGVTFAGWLQPPLGYAQYYDFPTPSPAPSGTYDSYIGVEGNVGIQAFAIFNSLSFFFAIATMIVGADAAFPMDRSYKYIGHVVATMKLLLRRAIKLLMISVVCVLGAFGSAAVVILPPHVYFRRHLVLTIFVGGGVCSVLLWQLLTRHSQRVQWINEKIRCITFRYTNIFAEPEIIRKNL